MSSCTNSVSAWNLCCASLSHVTLLFLNLCRQIDPVWLCETPACCFVSLHVGASPESVYKELAAMVFLAACGFMLCKQTPSEAHGTPSLWAFKDLIQNIQQVLYQILLDEFKEMKHSPGCLCTNAAFWWHSDPCNSSGVPQKGCSQKGPLKLSSTKYLE